MNSILQFSVFSSSPFGQSLPCFYLPELSCEQYSLLLLLHGKQKTSNLSKWSFEFLIESILNYVNFSLKLSFLFNFFLYSRFPQRQPISFQNILVPARFEVFFALITASLVFLTKIDFCQTPNLKTSLTNWIITIDYY